MKEFGVSDYDYEHRISVPLRTIMCIDLPRVDYDKGKMKKSEFDAVSAANKEASMKIREAREAREKARLESSDKENQEVRLRFCEGTESEVG